MGTAAALDVECVLDARATMGEGPTWSDAEQALYWVDIDEPALHRFDPSTGKDMRWSMPAQIGSFVLRPGGSGVIAALRTGIARVSLPSGLVTIIAPPPYDPLTYRFNDGKCDAEGRYWVGIMHEPLGPAAGDRPADWQQAWARPVQVFESGRALRAVAASAVITNGLAWSPDQSRMYVSDSATRVIWQFDFDAQRGDISNQRRLAAFEIEEGQPDGAAVDVNARYWCAMYGGGCVLCLGPDGRVEHRIALPVSQPTMCTFGGPGLDTLYITSSAKGLSNAALMREPLAGGIFACRPGVRGLPSHTFGS